APSKSDRNESAEPIANLLFAPSIQIRPALGTPRVSISDNWYYSSRSMKCGSFSMSKLTR
ncbi:hypothetical protein KX729_32505, partial [Rhizobium sp. XQZ8]|uniref:hypothetical protein n=1 Tax=Rhizobium populisoli TaxID=2859785 RepID=UPI001CA5EC7C